MLRTLAALLLALCGACSSNVPSTAGSGRGTTGSTTSSGGTGAGGCAGGCPVSEGCYQGLCFPTACPSGPCPANALCIQGSCACIDCTDGGTTTTGTSATTSGSNAGTTSGSISATTSGSASGTTSGSTSGSNDAGPTVFTLAGNGDVGSVDGTGGPTGTASFRRPTGVAVDDGGNVYVADQANNLIRKIDRAGNVTTVAGNTDAGCSVGTTDPNGTAGFFSPFGVAVTGDGTTVYVGDYFCDSVQRITGGNVGTLGATALAQVRVAGVAVDANGNVYVGDQYGQEVYQIDPAGDVSGFAGNGDGGFRDGTAGPTGTALFSSPEGVAVDGAGNVYVADTGNARIRKIGTDGNVTTVAGNGQFAFANGSGGPTGSAAFNFPTGVAVDATGNLYVADGTNNLVRKIDPAGKVTTYAGAPADGGAGGGGFADGLAAAAQFNGLQGIAVDGAGNVYVADTGNNRIRVIRP